MPSNKKRRIFLEPELQLLQQVGHEVLAGKVVVIFSLHCLNRARILVPCEKSLHSINFFVHIPKNRPRKFLPRTVSTINDFLQCNSCFFRENQECQSIMLCYKEDALHFPDVVRQGISTLGNKTPQFCHFYPM